MIGDVHRTVSWKRYLLETNSLRINNFLESRGNEVFYQISRAINQASIRGENSVVLLIHPNIKNIIEIKKKDFVTVLTRANNWFEKKEKYEICSIIKSYRESVLNKNTKIKSNKRIETLI